MASSAARGVRSGGAARVTSPAGGPVCLVPLPTSASTSPSSSRSGFAASTARPCRSTMRHAERASADEHGRRTAAVRPPTASASMESAAALISDRTASGMRGVAGALEDEAALETAPQDDQAASNQQSCARGA